METPSWPKLDEHLVQPEVTRDEVVRGERVVAMPARPEHGDRHFGLDYVLGAHIKSGYVGSSDLLTRFSEQSDFATDTCIRKAGKDPATGERYLEEVAFEVVHTQSAKSIRTRAEDISNRGVRRFFAVFVKRGEVGEWSAKDKDFVTLDLDGVIDDPTFATPVPVRALLDAIEADNGVARALLAKNNPVIEALRFEGKALAVIAVLHARGLPVPPDLAEELRACRDMRVLDAWLKNAATAATAAEVVLSAAPRRKLSRPR